MVDVGIDKIGLSYWTGPVHYLDFLVDFLGPPASQPAMALGFPDFFLPEIQLDQKS